MLLMRHHQTGGDRAEDCDRGPERQCLDREPPTMVGKNEPVARPPLKAARDQLAMSPLPR
jgi:hypothetical protein